MNLRFRLLPLLVSLFFAAFTAPGHAQRMSIGDGLKAAVIRADEVRIYAQLSADLSGLDDLLTKDCLYVHSSGRSQTKAEFLADLKSGALIYTKFQYTAAPLVRLYEGKLAIVTGTVNMEATTKAAGDVKKTLLTTCIYIIQNERWQLVSYQSTNAAP
ncbi:nuclear transport factor 2 family protein [Oleiharenicola lentus]|uniref:nuclear transport factor 2 family protein n=1 Tax=Oleiharenicola lentus TaxID=2508720 RepID=UPI003F66E323